MLFTSILTALFAAVAVTALPHEGHASSSAATPVSTSAAASATPDLPGLFPPGTPEIPPCVLKCFAPAVEETGCDISKGPVCICSDPGFLASMAECVPKTCTDEGIAKMYVEISDEVCAAGNWD